MSKINPQKLVESFELAYTFFAWCCICLLSTRDGNLNKMVFSLFPQCDLVNKEREKAKRALFSLTRHEILQFEHAHPLAFSQKSAPLNGLNRGMHYKREQCFKSHRRLSPYRSGREAALSGRGLKCSSFSPNSLSALAP
jgi:hypothetical protein